jgi:hypothetical protein
MRRYLLAAVVVVTLVLALTFPVAVPAAPPVEHHHIREAIASLRDARNDLQHAAHDFGGHRSDAVGAIDRAIEQLQICLQYDK